MDEQFEMLDRLSEESWSKAKALFMEEGRDIGQLVSEALSTLEKWSLRPYKGEPLSVFGEESSESSSEDPKDVLSLDLAS